MAKKSQSPEIRVNFTQTISENGKAPELKIPTANLAWTVCEQMRKDDILRSEKRSRIYKQYKRFSPTSYSKIIASGSPWQSNVCWGQLKFIVESQKSSLYDLVSESPQLVEIETKYGSPEERIKYSQGISFAFDYVLKNWDGYLVNCEQDILETLLYGKGIEIWDGIEGWQSQNKSINDFLVPDNARFDFRNVEMVACSHNYSPNELFRVIKDKDVAPKWNFEAVVDAIRYAAVRDKATTTREGFYHQMASGNVNLTSLIKEEIRTWQLYVREFDGSITKMIILKDYAPIVNGIRTTYGQNNSEESIMENVGFLYLKKNFCKSWDDFRTIFSDSAEEGMFHGIQGQAEQAYVGARQYDITMNRIVDAIYLNMMLMLSGGTPDSNKKLRELTMNSMVVLPDGLTIGQQKINIPTNEAIQVLTYQMRDMYSGMSVYKPNQATNGGRQRTKGEAELDAAEQSKVTGSQLRRFNEQRGIYYRMLYKKFISSGRNEKGHELRTMFDDLIDELGIPKDATDFSEIRRVKAKMLSGAGSQSMKVMAAEKTIQLSGMVAANDGQEIAIREAIAAWQGVGNVDTFRPIKKDVFTDVDRIISTENSAMSVDTPNPENFRVNRNDPHMEHAAGHFSDIMFDANRMFQLSQGGGDPEDIMEIIERLNVKGGHLMAHVQFIQMDESKAEEAKAIMQNMAKITQVIDQIGPNAQKALEAKQQQGGESDVTNDPEMQKEMALAAIKIDTAQKLSEIKVATIATSHELRKEVVQDKAANDIAIRREQAIQKATDERIAKSVSKPTKPTKK